MSSVDGRVRPHLRGGHDVAGPNRQTGARHAGRDTFLPDPLLRSAARGRGLGQGRPPVHGPRHRARPRPPPARRRPVDPADDEPGRGRGRDPQERGRGRPEPGSHGAGAAGDTGTAPGGPTRAAAPLRRLPRVHARLEGAREPGLGRVAGHHHGRRQQPAVRTSCDRRSPALGGRVRGPRDRSGARVLPLHRRRPPARRGAAPLGPGRRLRSQRGWDVRRALLHHRGRGPSRGPRPLGRPGGPRRRVPRSPVALHPGRRPPRGGRRCRGDRPLPAAASLPPDELPVGQSGDDGHRVPGAPRSRPGGGGSSPPPTS